MTKTRSATLWALITVMVIWFPAPHALADGGYFSARSVAVSADQRAIIIKNGNQISMTLSTGYTGDGEDFGWIIPTPTPPTVKDVTEGGPKVGTAFSVLDQLTAPVISQGRGGCFPAGTEVCTADGPRAIETVEPGTKVYAYDLSKGEWELRRVNNRLTHRYSGDVIAVQLDSISVEATGNHPFYVLRGDGLASRPVPRDLPRGEGLTGGIGRWIEARDLRAGDVLITRDARNAAVTGIAIRNASTEVYNLNVEGDHNYAVHRRGVLVHNKGAAEEAPPSEVRVFGTIALEHYQVSILGTAAASPLVKWLQEHDYQVNPEAQNVLNDYVARNWAFVAVKLNPKERRHYENEFLPPLVVRFQSEELVFPLRISSVSTAHSAKISLYVIAESTVDSPNYPTVTITYRNRLSRDPEAYIESCIQRATGGRGRRLALLWGGPLPLQPGGYPRDSVDEVMNELMAAPFPAGTGLYLTRIEARMDAAAMRDDILFTLDPSPEIFPPHFQFDPEWVVAVGIKTEPVSFFRTAKTPSGSYTNFYLTTMVYPPFVLPAFGLDLLWSTNIVDTGANSMAGVEANVSYLMASAGLSLVWELAENEQIPYLGLRVRFLDVPPLAVWFSTVRATRPLVDIGFDLLPMTVRWNLKTGQRLFTIGIASITLGRVIGW